MYGVNSPACDYDLTTAHRGDGTYRTYVRIDSVQTKAGRFVMPIDLNLLTSSGSQVRSVWNDRADEDFTLDTVERRLSVSDR